MTTFYVGQRVRVRWTYSKPDLVGKEGRIIEIRTLYRRFDDGSAWTAYGLDINPIGYVDGVYRGHSAEQLEPLLPSGHQPAELSVEELLPFLKSTVQA